VALVNPARVRQFTKACWLLAKTDKLDARLLAVFGQRIQPRLYEAKSEAEKQLSALTACRRKFLTILNARTRDRHLSEVSNCLDMQTSCCTLCWAGY